MAELEKCGLEPWESVYHFLVIRHNQRHGTRPCHHRQQLQHPTSTKLDQPTHRAQLTTRFLWEIQSPVRRQRRGDRHGQFLRISVVVISPCAAPWIPCISVVRDSPLTGLSEGQTTQSRHQSFTTKAVHDETPTLMRRNTQLTSGSPEMDYFYENTVHSSAQEATISRLLPSQFSFSSILI